MYADVLLPLAVDSAYTYALPDEIAEQATVGARVVVPLGARKFYTGIIVAIHENKPEYRTKSVVSLTDMHPIVSEQQLKFWQWIADYYMCTPGEVMKCAIPVALKAAGFSDDISENFRPKNETVITLGSAIRDEESLNAMFDSLGRAKAQYRALASLVGEIMPIDFTAPIKILKTDFSERNGVSHSILKLLEERKAITIKEREASRIEKYTVTHHTPPTLSEHQSEAMEIIKTSFESKNVVLLHGVTGSGKTEMYINLIAEQFEQGKDTLYLLPEIALTTQLIERLKLYFGDRIVVYHSRFNDNLRAECFLKLREREREPLLIMGVRSSILLPLDNVGLIIVDEEHENTYKQQDPAPRYNARDAAIVFASMCGSKVLLGSATPSVESYFNAVTGKYGLAKLTERYGDAILPQIAISDTIRSAKRGERTSFFSHQLLNEIETATAEGRQVILFQNRRGFSPYVECGECTAVISCPHCNVSLTYHKGIESLVCHYCGHSQQMPRVCPSCGTEDLRTMGFGTEKVEEEIFRIMPHLSVERLDLDSSRSEKRFSKIISSFASGRTNILVGTQMITKGFDFENVSLVGILNADNMINFPDFRAAERSFQLMTQVAGRAGRRERQGLVVVQTSQPKNPTVLQLQAGDYDGMFGSQIAERRAFLYPPFSRLVRFTLKHNKKDVLNSAVSEFNTTMRQAFGARLLGPEIPAVDKIRGEYLCGFLLKIERERSFASAKKIIRRITKEMQERGYGSLSIIIDVDPA